MTDGFILYPTYQVRQGVPVVQLYGKDADGNSFLIEDDRLRPHFLIRGKDLAKALKVQAFDHETSRLKDFAGEPLVTVNVGIPAEVPDLRKALEQAGVACYEADIRFAYRYLMDKGILGTVSIEGTPEKGERVAHIYHNPEVGPGPKTPIPLKVLSFDIESDHRTSEVLSIALYTDGHRKALLNGRSLKAGASLRNAEVCADEKALLARFAELVLEIDPDIVTGWNVIGFDLAMLHDRFRKHRLPFRLGRTDRDSVIRIYDEFLRDSQADLHGRVVLDGIRLLRINFISLEDYRLDTAAKVFLGEKKLITFENKGDDIVRLWKEEPQRLVDYNLKDAELVARILEKTGVLALSVGRSMLTGMPLDRVQASVASLDSLYIREATKRGYACPSSSYSERDERIKGGFVMESKPGIYDYIIVCDFKSLYPSIIRTFNIDPLSFDPEGEITAPNGTRFRNEDGILPGLIQSLWESRDAAKRRKDRAASYAIKITMNSFFGVLANPACRFYSVDMANAITHFGQHFIKLTSEKIRELGYEVIYGDTDSVFVKTGVDTSRKAEAIGREIQDYINTYYKDLVKREYKRDNFLELEFEKTFIRFLMPKLRGSDQGAKKRYAGILEKDGKEEIDFTGLEFVRRDWTELAKTFQLAILDRIFHKKEVKDYVRKFVGDVRSGKYDDQLVYRKAIRKSLDEYVKTTPPHVKAARKLKKLSSSIIEYYMTENGPEPVEMLTSRIDYAHYIEKQLKPIADSVLCFFGTDFDSLVRNHDQKSLFEF
ncbi:DNA polymerase II [Candidatus Woesearchaeota archaeon]|nr:DNA polymerase II [Candidatus Woesearchaeota archaeon]